MNTVLKYKARLFSAVLILGFARTACHGSDKYTYFGDDNSGAAAAATVRQGSKIECSFADYAKERGDQPLSVVIGCGREHRELTCGGFGHNHEPSYTIDKSAASAWGVSKPHRTGDFFAEGTCADITEVDKICAEHVPFGDDPTQEQVEAKRGDAIKESERLRSTGVFKSPDTIARQMASDALFKIAFDYLKRTASDHLKPGGKLVILPSFPLEGCFRDIIHDIKNAKRRFCMAISISVLINDLTKKSYNPQTDFSHMTLSFFRCVGRYPYTLDPDVPKNAYKFDLTAEPREIRKIHKRMVSDGLDRVDAGKPWNFVKLTLNKSALET